MKIGELAARCGLSVHTLRYYERIGLLPRVDRDSGQRRDYDSGILVWLAFLGRLKTTGMPIQKRLAYARLRAEGPGTSTARREMLIAHRAEVAAKLADLTDCLTVLDRKIADYTTALAEQEIGHDPDPCPGLPLPHRPRPSGRS